MFSKLSIFIDQIKHTHDPYEYEDLIKTLEKINKYQFPEHVKDFIDKALLGGIHKGVIEKDKHLAKEAVSVVVSFLFNLKDKKYILEFTRYIIQMADIVHDNTLEDKQFTRKTLENMLDILIEAYDEKYSSNEEKIHYSHIITKYFNEVNQFLCLITEDEILYKKNIHRCIKHIPNTIDATVDYHQICLNIDYFLEDNTLIKKVLELEQKNLPLDTTQNKAIEKLKKLDFYMDWNPQAADEVLKFLDLVDENEINNLIELKKKHQDNDASLSDLDLNILNALKDINKVDSNGCSMLIRCVEKQYTAGVAFLISKSADINIRNNYNYTALALAVGHSNNTTIIQLLLDAKPQEICFMVGEDKNEPTLIRALLCSPENYNLLLPYASDKEFKRVFFYMLHSFHDEEFTTLLSVAFYEYFRSNRDPLRQAEYVKIIHDAINRGACLICDYQDYDYYKDLRNDIKADNIFSNILDDMYIAYPKKNLWEYINNYLEPIIKEYTEDDFVIIKYRLCKTENNQLFMKHIDSEGKVRQLYFPPECTLNEDERMEDNEQSEVKNKISEEEVKNSQDTQKMLEAKAILDKQNKVKELEYKIEKNGYKIATGLAFIAPIPGFYLMADASYVSIVFFVLAGLGFFYRWVYS